MNIVTMNSSMKRSKTFYFFALMLATAYLYGVLSPQHYAPSVLDLYIGLGITIVLSIGILIGISKKKLTNTNSTAMVCIFFAVLVICQPLVSDIDYSDSLLFPITALLLMACLATVIKNVADKSSMATAIIASLYIGGMLTVCTQLLQLLSHPAWLEPLVFYGTDSSRPYGNVGQPNQAAFIISMALVAANYGFFKFKDQRQLPIEFLSILLIGSIVFLGIGQGLSASRGGLVLSLVSCLSVAILYKTSIKIRVLFASSLLSLISLSNWLGSKLLTSYADYQQTAIDRILSQDPSRPLRWYLQEQAWLTFSTDWLTGAGWGNLPKVALDNAESLNRFEFATHTHFLPSHIAAELGIIGLLGLLGLGLVILKGLIRSNHTIETKAVAILIILSLLYSGSEYPLWYMRFLFLFVVLVALIDTSTIKLKLNIKPVVIIYLLALILGSSFYMQSYRQYVAVDNLIKRSDVEDFESEILVYNLANIYGFSKFKEIMLFQVVSVNEENIRTSVVLGSRVVSNYLDPELMKKQAMLLALVNSKEDSLRLFKAACLYDFSRYCVEVEEKLQLLSDNQTPVFFDINTRFLKWRFEKR